MLPHPTPLDALLRARTREGSLIGAVALSARRDGVYHVSCSGLADTASNTPLAPDSIVRIHSMSKAITSVAALILVEQGLCSLETEVADLLPAFRSWQCIARWSRSRTAPALTLFHLLTHTSGLAYPNRAGTRLEREMARALGAAGECSDFPLAVWAERLGTARLGHEPGTRFTYGVSTDLLGHLVELMSGVSLDRFVRERITEPLGMLDTGFGVPPEKHHRIARLFSRHGNAHHPDRSRVHTQPAFLSGGGGLYSTGNDYLAFCRMLLGEGALGSTRLLSATTVRSFSECRLTGRISKAEIEASHGLGPGIGHGLIGRVVNQPERSSFGVRGTFGWDGMGGCTFFVDPKSDLASVFITQILPWQADLHPAVRRAAYATHALKSA